MMPNLLFGDNQFFGINHMSEEKARAQALQFQDIKEVFKTLDAAYDEGIKTFMCTTHDRVKRFAITFAQPVGITVTRSLRVCRMLTDTRTQPPRKAFLEQSRFAAESGAWSTAVRSGVSLVGKDIRWISRILMDAEMQMFDHLPYPVSPPENVVVDLLLGLGMTESFAVFSDHIQAHSNAEPGFITMNLPLLLDVLDDLKIDNPIVCSNINKLGFRMCGGLGAYQEALQGAQISCNCDVGFCFRRYPSR